MEELTRTDPRFEFVRKHKDIVRGKERVNDNNNSHNSWLVTLCVTSKRYINANGFLTIKIVYIKYVCCMFPAWKYNEVSYSYFLLLWNY